MSNVRAALGMAHNQYRSLISFNKLPDEIVVYILSLIDINNPVDPQYHGHSPIQYGPLPPLLGIMATSRHLRHIAIDTPSLWTHVDLRIEILRDTYWEYVRRVLCYSQQLPIQVRITGRIYDGGDEKVVSECLVLLLHSHAHRIVSLDLRTPLTCYWPIMLGLFTKIPSCQVQKLYIDDFDAYMEQVYETFPDRLLNGDLDAFLRSLRVIETHGFFIPLAATPAYGDLTILKISPFDFDWPTLLQLRNVLVACPKLRSLALIECNFEIDSQALIEPVFLPDLEILDLRWFDPEDDDQLLVLMSCIDSGPNELAFSLSTSETISVDTIAKLRRFIRRYNVTRLCWDSTSDDEFVGPGWLFSLPLGETLPIQELALCGYEFRRGPFNQPLSASCFPSLRTLHLMRCKAVDVQVCCQILDMSAIEMLRFDYPRHIAREIFGAASSVERCSFSCFIATNGGADCEWPVSAFW